MGRDFSFSPGQKKQLRLICDLVVPAISGEGKDSEFWQRKASDLDVDKLLETVLLRPEKENIIRPFGLFLEICNRLGVTPNEKVVQMLLQTARGRAVLSTLIPSVLLLYYGQKTPEGDNPNWPTLGFPGFPSSNAKEPIQPLSLYEPTEGENSLSCDTCIIGSGPGGGVVAAELAAAGEDVLILEAGDYYPHAELGQDELHAYKNLFYRGGPFRSSNGLVTLLAGSCVGGGSVVNWLNCVRTPGEIREKWQREHGLEGLFSKAFDEHLDAVSLRLKIREHTWELNGPNARLKEGAEALGFQFRRSEVNADPDLYDSRAAGLTCFGDSSKSKQSVERTFLSDAISSGARLICNARAEQIITENGRVRAIQTLLQSSNGRPRELTVHCKKAVLACGAIASPALLLRSNIGGANVGKNLKLHPTSALLGIYREEQKAWNGWPQTIICDHFAKENENSGFLIEAPAYSTGLYASVVPWTSGRAHKEMVTKFPRGAVFISLVEDKGSGKVVLGRNGKPVVHYQLSSKRDRSGFYLGQQAAAKLHRAAGASEIYSLSSENLSWKNGGEFESFLSQLQRVPLSPHRQPVFSAHQMATCSLGNSQKTAVASPTGELYDTKGVWVADGSAFPTASGVNPMLTIMAMARRCAHAMK